VVGLAAHEFWNMMRFFPRAHAGVIVMGNATSYEQQRIGSAAVGILAAG
jgi:hypothetical protein